jgi:hypothetical protein
MIRRIIAIVAIVLGLLGALSAVAPSASAQRIWPLIGCDSYLNWPCPGPVPAAR